MPRLLIVRYFGPGHELEWLRCDPAVPERAPVQRGMALVQEAGDHPVVVALPSEHVLLAQTQVPGRSQEAVRKAVPYALEERLAEPVEAMHFAYVPQPGAPAQTVVGMRRSLLEEWLGDLRARGVQADVMVPDALLLPEHPQGATALFESGRVVMRVGAAGAIAVQPEEWQNWLPLLRSRQPPIQSIRAVGPGPRPANQAFAIQSDPEQEPLHVMAHAFLAADRLPNLLCGPFAARRRKDPLRRAWLAAAALAALAVTLGFSAAALEYFSLRAQQRSLQAQMEQVYRSVYPQGRLGIAYADRMRADFRANGPATSQQSPLRLLDQVAPALTQGAQVMVKALEYRGNTLELVVLAPSVEMIDGLREQMAAQAGMQVTLAAVTRTDAGAEGRLRVLRGAP